jgi:segregation and condensation protein A
MAAMLAEIKARMLMPRPAPDDADDDPDPRAELVRRLRDYERFRVAGEQLDQQPRVGRDVFPARAGTGFARRERPAPRVELDELVAAFSAVMARAGLNTEHAIQREALSVRARMSDILNRLDAESFLALGDLLNPGEGRAGLVVTFLAVLELLRDALLELVQSEAYAPVYVRCAAPDGASST